MLISAIKTADINSLIDIKTSFSEAVYGHSVCRRTSQTAIKAPFFLDISLFLVYFNLNLII